MWTSLSYFGRRSSGRSGSVGPGGRATDEDPYGRDAESPDLVGDRVGIEVAIAVDDDLVPGCDALGLEKALDLGFVDGLEPGRREGDGTGQMPSSRLVVPSPAVIRGQRPDIDDGQRWLVDAFAQFVYRDHRHGRRPREVGLSDTKRPLACRGSRGEIRRALIACRTPRYTIRPAWQREDTDSHM